MEKKRKQSKKNIVKKEKCKSSLDKNYLYSYYMPYQVILDSFADVRAYVPISILSGTPFLSHSKYLAPGRTFSLSSTLTLQVIGMG